MKLVLILAAAGFAASSFAQQDASGPKKNPFAGFGNTGLDRRPGAMTPPSPAGKTPGAPAPQTSRTPVAASVPAASANGIALANDWAGHLTQGAGGQTMKMRDLQALLSGYGVAEADTAPHPEVTVYEGSPMDAALGQSCRVAYLMPLDKAEGVLFKNRGIVTATRAVAPGFPDGLFIHTYDVKAGIYNRLCILTDSAKPQNQVVSLLLKAESANWYPPSPPFKKLERDWHTHDYLNTENRGQPGIVIDTRVNDLRPRGRYIVVNITGGFAPPEILPPGIVIKPARNSPKTNATWYVPEPLIKLILHALSKQLEH